MNATRSWNLAIVTLGVCLAALIASAAALMAGWHTAAAGRAGGTSALALIASAVWLMLSARRLGPLEPEPDEDVPQCPYESCHHNQPEDAP